MTTLPAPAPPTATVAWRGWALTPSGLLASSTQKGVASGHWLPDLPHEARCLAGERDPSRTPCEHPPGEDCDCGIHAFALEALDWTTRADPVPAAALVDDLAGAILRSMSVVGLCALWGEVIEHAWGFRAELAYPAALALIPDSLLYRMEGLDIQDGLAERVAAIYHVPVSVIEGYHAPSWLREQAALLAEDRPTP